MRVDKEGGDATEGYSTTRAQVRRQGLLLLGEAKLDLLRASQEIVPCFVT